MAINWQDPLAALQSAISGVFSVSVGNSGSGYTLPPSLAIAAPPAGGIQATAVPVMGVGVPTISNAGKGYSSAPNVVFLGGGGSGASGDVILNPFTIGSVKIINPGNSFTSPPTIQFSGGGGSGATGTAVLSGGVVTGITVTDGGASYTSAPTISITGGGGLGALATANLESGGTITGTTLSGGSSDFTSTPDVTIGGPGSGASILATLNGSVVSITTNNVQMCGVDGGPSAGYTEGSTVSVSIGAPDFTITGARQATATGQAPSPNVVLGQILITITDPGAGYTSAPSVTIGPPDVPGTGATTAIGTSVINGSITALTIVDGGTGFTSAPTLTFTGGGGTMNPTATAAVATSAIRSITLTNGGYGYASGPVVSITGGGGSGAEAFATSSPSVIASIAVNSPGQGYTSVPDVFIIGGGGGDAKAVAVLAPTSVSGITISNPGTGYTFPPTATIAGGGGQGATATTTLQVVSVDLTAGGYEYPGAPAITFTSVDGNGSGASAFASMSPAFINDDSFSINQGIQIASELEAIGTLYSAGYVVTTPGRAVNYVVPTSINFGEMDKATRFAASQSSGWFTWPASWDMFPSSDPVLVMMRTNQFSRALGLYAGVQDPFIASTWAPLYAQAVPDYAYFLVQSRELVAGAVSVYEDNSSLGLQLQQLVATAEELTTYLNTA